jgi:hypothetical protein
MRRSGRSGGPDRSTVRRRTFHSPARWIVAAILIANVGNLSADAPRPNDRLPAELCTSQAQSDFGMVAAGSPEATRAAVDMLERGGNAIMGASFRIDALRQWVTWHLPACQIVLSSIQLVGPFHPDVARVLAERSEGCRSVPRGNPSFRPPVARAQSELNEEPSPAVL